MKKTGTIEITWENGRRSSLGTITVTMEKTGMHVQSRGIRRRFGLELIRTGLRILLHREDGEHDQIDAVSNI